MEREVRKFISDLAENGELDLKEYTNKVRYELKSLED